MGRFGFNLFSSKGGEVRPGTVGQKMHGKNTNPIKTASPHQHHKSLHKIPSHSQIFRNKTNDRKLGRETSYDLSTFFLFRDDPDAISHVQSHSHSTVITEATSKITSPSKESDELVQFDFAPAISFDLGIRSSDPLDQNNKMPEPMFMKPVRAGSEITNSLAFARETDDLISKSTRLNNKHNNHNKKDRSRPRSGSTFKFSPHNQYLSEHYDAKRIEMELKGLDTPPEQDVRNKRKNRKRPLHREIFSDHDLDISLDDGQISKQAAIDEGLSIDGYSLLNQSKRHITVKFDTEQEHDQEFTINPSKTKSGSGYAAYTSMLKEQDDEQDSEVYIPGPTHDPSDRLMVHQFSGISDDNLSINNVLAVERFITAPRLCKGTKNVPSSIQVMSSSEEDDGDRDIFVSLSASPSMESKSSTMTPKAKTSSSISARSNSKKDDFESWNRVKHHISQLPSIQQLLSDDFEDLYPSGPSSGSRKSYGSPVGIEQFDERRPWRKPSVQIESEKLAPIDEQRMILDLKSRVETILTYTYAIPNDTKSSSNKENLPHQFKRASTPTGVTDTDAVSRIKSRRRDIESKYSFDGYEPSFKSSSTRSSVHQLKEKLRQLESGIGSNNSHNVSSIPVSIRI